MTLWLLEILGVRVLNYGGDSFSQQRDALVRARWHWQARWITPRWIERHTGVQYYVINTRQISPVTIRVFLKPL